MNEQNNEKPKKTRKTRDEMEVQIISSKKISKEEKEALMEHAMAFLEEEEKKHAMVQEATQEMEKDMEEMKQIEKELSENDQKFRGLRSRLTLLKAKDNARRKKLGMKGENPKQFPQLPQLPNGMPEWLPMVGMVIGFLLLANWLGGTSQSIKEVPISEFQQTYQEREFSKVELTATQAIGEKKSGEKISSKTGGESMKNLGLDNAEINAETKVEMKTGTWQEILWDLFINLLPILLFLGFMMYSMRGMKGGMPFFGKQKGMDAIKPDTTFADVAGNDEAKFELQEIVEFLKSPDQFTKMGAKIPKGVLLSGPPGTGKTLLARAVAGEAHAPFFSISGSEFVEMFVGVGASRVRALFENARKNAPSIIFIDEIDAVGRQRNSGMGGGNDEREQTLNQILTEMDGFENDTGVIVIAATNRPDILDKALLRPGRFDRRITVNNPTIKDRVEILKVHSAKKPLAEEISLEKLGARTAGFSGADLENMMNEAAIFAARAKRDKILKEDIDNAIDRVTMGTERKSLVMSEEEKKMTAYHEVGHAMAAHLLKTPDPVHKITIVPRGMALGATHIAPETESYHTTKKQYFEEICVLLGGLSAEKLVFDDTTSGVSNDLERATRIAYAMVSKFGMSEEIGPFVFSEVGSESFSKKHSEEYARKVDEQVQKILKEAFETTKKLLKENEKLLEKISLELLEKETLDRDEFESFFHA